jgi:hypothetical protein
MNGLFKIQMRSREMSKHAFCSRRRALCLTTRRSHQYSLVGPEKNQCESQHQKLPCLHSNLHTDEG